MRAAAVSSAALFAALFYAPRAHADASSWLFLGGGGSSLEMAGEGPEVQPLFQLETGVGSSPADPLIIGGLGRMQTHFGQGTDLGLALRLATHGFVNGQWGGALDLGGYQRWWGSESTGFAGALVLGAPWGITMSLGAHYGSNDAQGFSGVLGIDLLRLTVYRRSGESWWKNSFPAYRPEDER